MTICCVKHKCLVSGSDGEPVEEVANGTLRVPSHFYVKSKFSFVFFETGIHCVALAALKLIL